MAEIRGVLSVGSKLSGTLGNNVYTLPTASPTRLGGIKVGEGLSIDSDGVLNTVKQNTYSNLSLIHTDGAVNKSAASPDDTIELNFKPAFKIEEIGGVLTVNLNFGSYLDDDKPMSGSAVKVYIDSVNRGFELELGDLEDWLANTYVSENTYIPSQIYEVKTDESGYAALPFTEDNQIAYVFINGILAVEGKDYQITDGGIQVTTSDFVSGNDVVTFVVLKPTADSRTNDTIGISSEIYEAQTDSNGYARLPFTYDNQLLYIFANGVFATKQDYQINDNGILFSDNDFVAEGDVVTFIVFNPLLNGADSKSLNVSLKTYETQTDVNGNASLPLIPKVILKRNDNSAVQVFINGLYAVEGKDYQIEEGSIQLTSSEYLSGNDVITFVIFEAKVDDNSGGLAGDIETISISEIDEIINN